MKEENMKNYEYVQTRIRVEDQKEAKRFIFELTQEIGAEAKLSPLLSFLFEQLKIKYESGGIEAIKEELKGIENFHKSIDKR
jgi:hypothetical protein